MEQRSNWKLLQTLYKDSFVADVSDVVYGSLFLMKVQPCTTSRFGKNEDPLLCPHGYTCHVSFKGNRKKRIQNRGYCVPDKVNGNHNAL